ncbi:hypothetical protein DYB36_001829 [Aphanomyces astaci]|uniref:Uncharacterized protein n=1 Tax=Aphanomyces astaci TaxID=112090 RepID=A0A397B0A4_APHAT|nr:hypothetical protein DYB36_001829 [Aphanomyces astaci]
MKPKRFRKQVPRTYLWCDDSVEKMFMLRYKSALASRFESKNNYGKRVAYVMLATKLSVSMEREFTAKQVQDKLAKMKSEWSLSKPSLASPTGNATKPPQPMHFDVMLEYWGDKIGYKRESLMSTDDVSEDDSLQNSTDMIGDAVDLSFVADDDDAKEIKIEMAEEPSKKKQKKSSRDAKAKSQSESLEAGFNAIKEGLMFLGTSMSQQPQVQPAPGATLDDVLIAIKSQSDTMTQLLSHLVAQKENKNA